MRTIISLSLLLVVMGISFACGSQSFVGGGDSPTESYKRLYAACKAKDIDTIKKQLSKKSLDFGVMAAAKNNTPVEKVYENGFTATTFSDTLPTIRDERIKDDMGAVEVWNSKESKWEDLPFVLEDGSWKLAVGELFANTFKSPGRGRDSLEKEAANAVANTSIPMSPNSNTNIPGITAKGPEAPTADKDKNAK